LRLLTKDPSIDDRLAADHGTAGLEEREVAMLDWALAVTRDSNGCSEAHLDRLRSLGWTDEDLMDMTETAAMFNLTNRLANALAWEPNPEYETLGR
jgi:uncharacterized peroxidase-related enzyme